MHLRDGGKRFPPAEEKQLLCICPLLARILSGVANWLNVALGSKEMKY